MRIADAQIYIYIYIYIYIIYIYIYIYIYLQLLQIILKEFIRAIKLCSQYLSRKFGITGNMSKLKFGSSFWRGGFLYRAASEKNITAIYIEWLRTKYLTNASELSVGKKGKNYRFFVPIRTSYSNKIFRKLILII